MKVETNFDKEKGIFVLPVIAIGYKHKEKQLSFVFMFACWAFSIEFDFKQQFLAQFDILWYVLMLSISL